MNKCLRCGKNSEKEYCWKCAPRKSLKQSSLKKKSNKDIMVDSGVPNGEGVYNNIKMREFFLGIWAKRPHYSEISNTYLGSEPLTTFFHHIMYKESYPELMYEEDNIILLLPDEHHNSHSDKFRYEEINARREKLKEKYGIQ